MKPGLSSILVVCGFLIHTNAAHACSCVRGDDRAVQKFIRLILKEPGAALVDAEVVSESGGELDHTTTFKVIETWAGAPGATIAVHHTTSSAACGVTFKPGERVFLLAPVGDSGPKTNLCTQIIASRVKPWGKAAVKDVLK